jgi:hypothetical protein
LIELKITTGVQKSQKTLCFFNDLFCSFFVFEEKKTARQFYGLQSLMLLQIKGTNKDFPLIYFIAFV